MKHDPHVIRELLAHAARTTHPSTASEVQALEKHDAADTNRHLHLLMRKGLIEGKPAPAPDGPHIIHGLTGEGRRFLRAISSEKVKEKIRSVSETVGDKMSFEIMMEIAKAFLMDGL